MRGIFLSFVFFVAGNLVLPAAEVEVKSGQNPAVTAPPPQQQIQSPSELPQYRPALLGVGPTALINRIDTQSLIKGGQKDASVMFSCTVTKTGGIGEIRTYRGTAGSSLLERELVKRLEGTTFIPAIYNHQPVHVIFFGTVVFSIPNGKTRLRIFANQEMEELKKESDFIGPQPFVGRESKFEGIHYPEDVATAEISGLVDLAMKIDADGNLKELRVVTEEPPLIGFARAASEDFRVAKFIPAFRDGKVVECSITLPIYYEPQAR